MLGYIYMCMPQYAVHNLFSIFYVKASNLLFACRGKDGSMQQVTALSPHWSSSTHRPPSGVGWSRPPWWTTCPRATSTTPPTSASVTSSGTTGMLWWECMKLRASYSPQKFTGMYLQLTRFLYTIIYSQLTKLMRCLLFNRSFI